MTIKQWLIHSSQEPTPWGNLVLQAIHLRNRGSISIKHDRQLAYHSYQAKLQHRTACVITARSAGLFSLVFQVLEQIDVCQRFHVTPLVYWNKICPYWSDQGYAQKRNVWDYYFEPVSKLALTNLTTTPVSDLEQFSSIQLAQAITEPTVVVSDQYLYHLIPELYVNEKQRHSIHNLIKQYIVIHPAILQKVDQFYTTHLARHKIIGVHLRGKEKYTDLHFTGRGYLALEYYYTEIDRYLTRYPEAKIFLASDSKVLSAQFIERYPELVYQTTAERSNDDNGGMHLQMSAAELGEQVLIDCLLLSRCDYLVHGISNVPFAAAYFNPALPHVDIYQKYRWQSLWKWLQGKERPLDIAKRLL